MKAFVGNSYPHFFIRFASTARGRGGKGGGETTNCSTSLMYLALVRGSGGCEEHTKDFWWLARSGICILGGVARKSHHANNL